MPHQVNMVGVPSVPFKGLRLCLVTSFDMKIGSFIEYITKCLKENKDMNNVVFTYCSHKSVFVKDRHK